MIYQKFDGHLILLLEKTHDFSSAKEEAEHFFEEVHGCPLHGSISDSGNNVIEKRDRPVRDISRHQIGQSVCVTRLHVSTVLQVFAAENGESPGADHDPTDEAAAIVEKWQDPTLHEREERDAEAEQQGPRPEDCSFLS